MAYLGSIPATQYSRMAKQTITGNGGAVYTLDYAVGSEAEIEVFVNNVRQEPVAAYSVAGTTLTMTDNILSSDSFYVVFQGKAIPTGNIPEKDDSGNYNFDNGTLFVDAANNRVGIGTTPSTQLHVYGADAELRLQSSSNTSGYLRFINTSGSMSIGMSGAATNTLLTYDRINNHIVHQYLGGGSGYHTWYTNGSERVRIDYLGNVGVGDIPGAYRLDVFGNIRTNSQILVNGQGGNGITMYDDIAGSFISYGYSGTRANTAGHRWYNGKTTETMRIATDGNVGIGTASPQSKLHVYKASYSSFTGTSLGAAIISDSGGDLNYFSSLDFNTNNNNNLPIARIAMKYTSSGSHLHFGTSNNYASGITTTGMTIDPFGRVNMPHQPAFWVRGVGTQVWSGTTTYTKVDFSSGGSSYVTSNKSSGWNQSNSRFTAPIGGTYEFILSFVMQSEATGPAAILYKNGSSYIGEVSIGYYTPYKQIVAIVYMDLAVSDYVEFWIANYNNTTFTIDKGRTYFAGKLIS